MPSAHLRSEMNEAANHDSPSVTRWEQKSILDSVGEDHIGSGSSRTGASGSSSGAHESFSSSLCAVRFAWPDRGDLQKIFREPYAYDPNANCL